MKTLRPTVTSPLGTFGGGQGHLEGGRDIWGIVRTPEKNPGYAPGAEWLGTDSVSSVFSTSSVFVCPHVHAKTVFSKSSTRESFSEKFRFR